MKLLALSAVTACGGATKPTRSEPAEPPYRPLFERGRTWSLPIESVDGEHRGDEWVATAMQRGTVTCVIAEVEQVGDADVSRVRCAEPYAGLLVVGTWVATPAGLYHPALPIDHADELALLGDDDLLVTARPEEHEHTLALGALHHATDAFSFHQTWCVHEAIASGDDCRHYTLCFSSRGVTGGNELTTVGEDHSWQRITFGTQPDHPDDPTIGREP